MPRYFALVPAAGQGSRLASSVRKQHLLIAEKPLLYYAIRELARHPLVSEVFVVLAPDDSHFRTRDWQDLGAFIRPLYCGGETRAASVLNGLTALRESVESQDWMLVHDAARPCLSAGALERLITQLAADDTGGLLAIPVADTLKREDGNGHVLATERRERLWQAQTPQMFRYGVLIEALRAAGAGGVTDEAGAVEKAGLKPRLVMGETRNLKVTYPEDLELAALILATSRETTPIA